MKLQNTVLLIALLVLFSCQDNKEQRLIENAKDAKKKETIFNNINKGWNFNANPINPAAQGLVSMWPEWRGFLLELNSKPKSTIGAFQKKAKELSKKVLELNNNIPIVNESNTILNPYANPKKENIIILKFFIFYVLSILNSSTLFSSINSLII